MKIRYKLRINKTQVNYTGVIGRLILIADTSSKALQLGEL